MRKLKRLIIGFTGKPALKGGPASFQERFETHAKNQGWQIVYPSDKIRPDAIIVNGSTSHIFWLIWAKLHGTVIIYRLGGISWLYKLKPEIGGFKKWLISLKYSIIPIFQRLLGNAVIYQSEFSKLWLLKLRQCARIKDNIIIYNGVDTELFSPILPKLSDKQKVSLICVEGNLDYTPYAVDLLNYLQHSLVEKNTISEIKLYGDFEVAENRERLNSSIKWFGLIPRNEVHKVYQYAIYLSLDINPGCPNSLLEALACGIPVVGFNTGSLSELVSGGSGVIVSYDGDPWKLDIPDFALVSEAIERVISNYEKFSTNARRLALEKYSLEAMMDKYEKKILQVISNKN